MTPDHPLKSSFCLSYPGLIVSGESITTARAVGNPKVITLLVPAHDYPTVLIPERVIAGDNPALELYRTLKASAKQMNPAFYHGGV